jgi:hypothetical protein
MGRRSLANPAQWEWFAKLYWEQGFSLKDLGERAGVNPETIRQGLLRRGVKLRPPHKTIGPTGRKPKYRD